MDQLGQVKNILRDTLNIGHRADKLTMDSPLMGSIPEFDSMAVVQVIAMIEERCGITVDDDELSADVFATVGSLTRFLATKTSA